MNSGAWTWVASIRRPNRPRSIRALAEFEGAVLLISHDPHLVELVADRLWLVGDGRVAPFDGDMADYRVWLGERARAAARETPGKSTASWLTSRCTSSTAPS